MSRVKDPDNPEWTEEMFRRARPAREFFSDFEKFPKTRGRGPQKAPTKVQMTIRLDRDVVEYFRRSGSGWHGRMNETLRRAVERQRRAKS